MESSDRGNENRLIDLNQGGPEPDPFAPQVPKEAIFHRKDSPPTLDELDPNRHDPASQTCKGSIRPHRIDYDEAGDSRLPPIEVRRVETNVAVKVKGDWVATTFGRITIWLLLIGLVIGGGHLVVQLWRSSPGGAVLLLCVVLVLIDIIRMGLIYGEDSMYNMPGQGFYYWRWWGWHFWHHW